MDYGQRVEKGKKELECESGKGTWNEEIKHFLRRE
jgi:hypothetical protein